MTNRRDIARTIACVVASIFVAVAAVLPALMVWAGLEGGYFADWIIIIGVFYTAQKYTFIGLPVYFGLRWLLGKVSCITYAAIGAFISVMPFLLGLRSGFNVEAAAVFACCGAAAALGGTMFLNYSLATELSGDNLGRKING